MVMLSMVAIGAGEDALLTLLSSEITAQLDLNKVSFVSNDRLRDALARTTATPEQVDEAVRTNTQSTGLNRMAPGAKLECARGNLRRHPPTEPPR